MIITFKKMPLLAKPWEIVNHIVNDVSAKKYNGNLYAVLTWQQSNRVRFTIETYNSKAHGSRKSWSGRHMRKASWEAHRDVMFALFAIDPEARLQTSLATYRGSADFERKYPGTAFKNIGSIINPTTMPDQTI